MGGGGGAYPSVGEAEGCKAKGPSKMVGIFCETLCSITRIYTERIVVRDYSVGFPCLAKDKRALVGSPPREHQ